jgi:4-hydroxy-tetrahydrodipicolinate synthase
VAEAVKMPIVLYNVPGRTAVNILPTTVARLAEIKHIVAIKEATGDMKQVSEVIRLCGGRITVLSGDDFTTLPLLALGGKGVISVSANIVPKLVSDMCALWEGGRFDEARAIHFKLEPLNAAMFIETNPIPVKTALALMGKIKEEFRLPLCEMAPANREKLEKVLEGMKLI